MIRTLVITTVLAVHVPAACDPQPALNNRPAALYVRDLTPEPRPSSANVLVGKVRIAQPYCVTTPETITCQ